ncbi:MAG: dihydroorotate dehydrogenase electron transfer subunit [Spirochaetes bacterium]|jgi:dihydroorotate dehydrogenase electron transfer subunit|nr:dihydroorotate dehydrogenase electron transfer subunit [Spirochaetota bacterium]
MAQLIENPLPVARDHVLLKLRYDDATAPAPGQFVNIKTTAGTDPLVRRPFSIFDFDRGIMEIVVRVIGRGTRLLGEMRAGARVDMLGPLGRGFTLIEGGRALLIGGGVGNAPLYYLARELKRRGTRVSFVYGARSADLIYCKDRFAREVDEFHLSTDDGSEGRGGYCTETACELLEDGGYDRVYVCGPTPMMEGMVRLAAGSPVPMEVSLENYFGCGVGLCSGCTVETSSGLRRACVDGPVMDARAILWDSLSGGH